MALRFAQEGWKVIVTGRRKERLEKLCSKLQDEYNAECIALPFDIRSRQACFDAVASLPTAFPTIDLLVNNAGGAWGRDKVQDALLDDFDIMLDTNVKGLMYLTKAVLPGMLQHGQGHIINIGSIAGKEVYEAGNGYNAAKFAVDALTKAMRMDLLGHNIKVTHIAPGAAETEFSLVRFKGDEQKAASVYEGFTPLSALDIADIVYYVATLPPHVCINDLVVTPTAQANSYYIHRNK